MSGSNQDTQAGTAAVLAAPAPTVPAPGIQAPAAPQGQVGTPFFLNPAGAMTGTLDFTQVETRKYFHKATKKLDQEELYDCSPSNMFHFLKLLKQRANEHGWDDDVTGILWVPEDHQDATGALRYMPTEYGRLTMEQISNFEKSYLGLQTRAAQDSYMLFKCLMSSLSKEARMKIESWEEEYLVRNNQGTTVPSGNLLLKVIIRESHIDTNATTQSIRMKLSNLDEYIVKIDSDITKFNNYVKMLISSLQARGQRTEDLLSHLFKGYMAASDKTFVRYIDSKKEKYEEGKALEPGRLMQLADNRFRLLKEREEWDAPSQEEEKLMALQAEVDKLKRGNKRRPESKNHRNETKSSSRKKSKKYERKEKPAWMNERPKEEDLFKPRQWNGNDWWYCHPDTGGKCDGAYRRHKPSQCEGRAFQRKKAPNKNYSSKRKDEEHHKSNEDNNDNRKLKVSEALNTIVDDQFDEQSSSDGYDS